MIGLRGLMERVRGLRDKVTRASGGKPAVLLEYHPDGSPKGHWACGPSGSVFLPFNGRDAFPPPRAQVIGEIAGVDLDRI
jgi:hypothetical protein